jgi:hypothetical protein
MSTGMLVADQSFVFEGAGPHAVYITVEQLLERDDQGRPSWTILGILPVEWTGYQFLTLEPIGDTCDAADSPPAQHVVAVLLENSGGPEEAPVRVWGWDEATAQIVELDLSAVQHCVQIGD